MSVTIFDDIVSGRMKSWKVWENEEFLAFLTPFPNTPGFTVVIPKENIGDYIFSIDPVTYSRFMLATRIVANILERTFKTPRVALVFEGTGVAHVHAKLMPLHGELATKTDVWSSETEFSELYRGWITTLEGPKMNDDELDKIQAKIIEAQQ